MKPTSNKADLYHFIIDDEPDSQMSTDDTDGPPQSHEVILIDGEALIHTMSPKTPSTTFDDYATTVFGSRLRWEFKTCDRLDIVRDRYSRRLSRVIRVVEEVINVAVHVRESAGRRNSSGFEKMECFLLCSTDVPRPIRV